MELTPEQQERYARQLVIPEIGVEGQKRLRSSRVLVVGAGGLGSPAALYLAAAGVGGIGLVDSDLVELSNLQRQILHGTSRIGQLKARSGEQTLRDLNPEVEVEVYPVRLARDNVLDLLKPYDVIISAVDNFEARYLLNDACYFLGKPLVEAGVLRWEGIAMTILPGQGPCYRCIFPAPPSPGAVPSPREAGVVGVVPGIMGTIQAAEALKLLLGVGNLLVGRLLLFNALSMTFREVEVRRSPGCPLCGDQPTGRTPCADA
jgi:adenylyltransferase/sulfurtransferase